MKKNKKSIFGFLIIIVCILLATVMIYQENTKVKTPPKTSDVKTLQKDTKPKNEKEKLVAVSVGMGQGDQAPEIELKDIEGNVVKLSDYRGKVVLLNFWASWCPPCREEMPDLVKFYNDHKEEEFVILGVNMTQMDNKEEAIAFTQSYNVNYPILMDEYNQYTGMYQVLAFPTSYLIDENGILREKFIGQINYELLDSKYQQWRKK